MDRSVKISDARARLFDLVDEVIGSEDSVILIEHRDRAERAALIGERHLRYLQRVIDELRKAGGRTFQLAGSVRLSIPASEAEDALVVPVIATADSSATESEALEGAPALGGTDELSWPS